LLERVHAQEKSLLHRIHRHRASGVERATWPASVQKVTQLMTSDPRPFSFIDLDESDHEMATFKYVGPDIKCATCICATSPESCSLLAGLTESRNPTGYFIITIHDVMNPIDYANGGEAATKFIRSFRDEIFIIDTFALVLLRQADLCTFQIANSIFDLIQPVTVVALTSTSRESFLGHTDVPKLFCVTRGQTEDPRLPPPNTVQHSAAALLAIGEVRNIPTTVWDVVEESTTLESMMLLANCVARLMPIDVGDVAKRGLQLATGRPT
jgi:hypothetical protein